MTGRGFSLHLKLSNGAKYCVTILWVSGSSILTAKTKEAPIKEKNKEEPSSNTKRQRTRKEKHEMLSDTRGRSPNNTIPCTMGRIKPTVMLDAGCYTLS